MSFEKARPLDEGMGLAVARRTVFRASDQEDMGHVADRVAGGNINLARGSLLPGEFVSLRNHMARGSILSSGRHLQHGDLDQATRNMEVFTNCATAALSFAKFYLLLNGSGVGRDYSDDMMVVDWNNAPNLVLVLSPDHPDYPTTESQLFQFACDFDLLGWQLDPTTGSFLPPTIGDFTDDVRAKTIAYRDQIIKTEVPVDTDTVYEVEDSREGWAKGFEIYESMTHAGLSNDVLALVFSKVRGRGEPIGGMQNRPASGPLSVMRGFNNIAQKVVGQFTHLWEQAMNVDHYLSVEVQVGGARRAARMSTKNWHDKGIFEFIRIKSEGGLWTSNNSVLVDRDFWDRVWFVRDHGIEGADPWTVHAWKVFLAVTECAYINGEPGFINADELESYQKGYARDRPIHSDGRDFGSQRYSATWAKDLLKDVAAAAVAAFFPMIVNPCGEIELHVLGGYCVIGDVAPLLACPWDFLTRQYGSLDELAAWDDKVEEAVRLQARFLMRVNLMDSLYGVEVRRTNRIGVSLTGIHEYAWLRFGYTFPQLIQEDLSINFWRLIKRFSDAVKDECVRYASVLGVEVPHTCLTIKPAGTTSKLHALSEGAHLPAMRQFIRWVQYRGQKDWRGEWPEDADPLLKKYEALGYPVRPLQSFAGMSIVGFPTVPLICRLMPNDKIVTANEATPDEQYRWLKLLEKYWLGADRGNQISYTLKLWTTEHTLEDLREICLQHQSNVRACALMPSVPDSQLGYEYLPEQEVSLEAFDQIVSKIKDEDVKTGIDMNTLSCASGACPI